MVFHDQNDIIQQEINKLNKELSYMELDNLCIHTGPIIRKEEIYQNLSIIERRRIFNKMISFIRQIDIRYHSFCIKKKQIQPVNYQSKYQTLSTTIIVIFYHMTM